jgi:hypothetical protein
VLFNAIVFALAAATMTTSPVVEANAPGPAGAFELLICKGTCSFSERSNVVAQGVLVMVPTALAPSERSALRKRGFERVHWGDQPPNACFVLDTVVRDRTFAGLVRTGIASWSLRGSSLTIGLYSSPDAGYSATIRLIGDRLEGDGTSWGGAEDEPNSGQDTLVGRRVGAAFPMKCIEAAQAKE